MIRAIAFTLLGLAALSHAEIPSKPTVSVAVKDSNVAGGLEGLDINWNGVYNLNGVALGFKYALNAMRDRPEAIFAKKSFSTIGDGELTLDSEYDLPKKTFSVLTSWASKSAGIVVSALASSKDQLQKIGLKHEASNVLGADSLKCAAELEMADNTVSVDVSYAKGATAFNLAVDNKDLDPKFSVAHKMDKDTLSPSISLKSGTVKYGWTRAFDGGSVESVLTVGDELAIKWKDDAKCGGWTSKVSVPLDDRAKKAKISVSRDWAV